MDGRVAYEEFRDLYLPGEEVALLAGPRVAVRDAQSHSTPTETPFFGTQGCVARGVMLPGTPVIKTQMKPIQSNRGHPRNRARAAGARVLGVAERA